MNDFYKRLKEKLNDQTAWPSVYTFKFIVPSEQDKIQAVKDLFRDGADISTKESSKGKYTSVTCKQMVKNADQIISTYQEAGKIQGIISL